MTLVAVDLLLELRRIMEGSKDLPIRAMGAHGDGDQGFQPPPSQRACKCSSLVSEDAVRETSLSS